MDLPPPSGKQHRKSWRREQASKAAPEKRFWKQKVKHDANRVRHRRRYPGQFLKVKK